MAIKNLKKELDTAIATFQREAKKGSKSGGGDDPFRNLFLNMEEHSITYTEQQTVEELKGILVYTEKIAGEVPTQDNSRETLTYEGNPASMIYSEGARLERGQYDKNRDVPTLAFGKQDDAELKRYAKRLLEEIEKEADKAIGSSRQIQIQKEGSAESGILTIIGLAADNKDKTVFDAVNKDILGKTNATLKPEFLKLFQRGAQQASGSGGLGNWGHKIGVATKKAAVIENILSRMMDKLPPHVKKPLQKLRDELNQEFPLIAKHKITLDMKSGKLVGSVTIDGEWQSWSKNQQSLAKAELRAGQRRKRIEAKMQALLAQSLPSANIKQMTEGEYSEPFIVKLGSMITQQASIKRLEKKGLAHNLSRYKSTPKSKPEDKTKSGWKRKTKRKNSKPANMLAGMKFKSGPGARRGTSGETPQSTAPLIALLQAKLPQTVAKNMGPPGLQNQTGRFAGSVQVTDVIRTAQGYPSVGYTYQKNPYQVFEMTHGDPRWATPSRDPRTLIDASLREIAAQYAIGRFYTRRV